MLDPLAGADPHPDASPAAMDLAGCQPQRVGAGGWTVRALTTIDERKRPGGHRIPALCLKREIVVSVDQRFSAKVVPCRS